MAKLKIDYSEARDWYVKGEKEKDGRSYPSLTEIAREFEYSLSTLRKKAANEGWFKRREERTALKEIISMRKEFMGKAIKLSRVSLNSISAADFLITKIKEEQADMEKGIKPYDIHIATKQIWALNQAVRLSKLSQDTLDDIENGYMSPLEDIGFI
jgi:intein/homing endonuclease